MVSVVIPVGGSRVKDVEKLTACVESIANQDYLGEIEILLVVDPDNKTIKDLTFPGNVRFVDFHRLTVDKNRDTNARRKKGLMQAKGEILGVTGVSMVFPKDTVAKAIALMNAWGVEAVDGVSVKMPDDNSFFALFQDNALITEFPKYHKTFVLSRETMGEDQRMPCMTSFFIKRSAFDRVKSLIPVTSYAGWDDYNMARAIVEDGNVPILCANELVSYRNHRVTLRLGKQFTSGVSGMQFYLQNRDNPYAQKRMKQAMIVASLACFLFLAVAIGFAVYGPLSLLAWAGVGVVGLAGIGFLNYLKARFWQAFFFPPFMVIQVLLWVAGFLYTGIAEMQPDGDLILLANKYR